jgi:hypothetical protein
MVTGWENLLNKRGSGFISKTLRDCTLERLAACWDTWTSLP